MSSHQSENTYRKQPLSLFGPLFLLLLLTGSALAQTIRYVKPTGTGDGSSWANASGNLQAMITASNANDQVWVAAGTYTPTTGTDRTISFSMKEGVAIYGGFAGNESTLSARPVINPVTGQPSGSTLSGDIGTQGDAGDNSYHIIKNGTGLTTAAILDGFVITKGNANNSGAFLDQVGSGVFNDGYSDFCNPTFRNCSFHSNSAGYGGAIYNQGMSGNCSPHFINCFLQGNSATTGGGAICNQGSFGNSNPQLTNCIFQGNSSQLGGAINNDGRSSGNSSPQLINCVFQSNSAQRGGAIHNEGTGGNSSPQLINCLFYSNSAGYGGAMHNYGATSGNSSPQLTNCTFRNNSSYLGQVMYNTGSFSGNSNPKLTNSLLWNNGGSNSYYNDNASITITFSLFEPSSTVTGVDISDPGNLTTTTSPFLSENSIALKACSPAINAGDPATTSALAGATDLAGNPRFYTNGRIDMGAVEFQNNAGEIATQPVPGSVVCAGSNITAMVSVSGVGPFTYQWFRDNQPTPVASQTAITLSLSNVTTTDAGSYSVGITGGCSSITASVYSLTVTEPPTGFAINSATVCQGQSATLIASGCPAEATLRWEDGSTLTSRVKATAGSVSASCIVGNCAAVTANATVTVSTNAPAPPAAIAGLQASTGGCPYSLSGQATGNGFVVSGPNGYVFSNVYRDGGASQPVSATGIKVPGTYTLTATYTNSCGSNSVSQTVVVSGNRCP